MGCGRGFPPFWAAFLGSALLPRVLQRTGSEAKCLVQARYAAQAAERIEQLATADSSLRQRIRVIDGGITRPGLGVGADVLAQVTEAWHLAAVYDLSIDHDTADRAPSPRSYVDRLGRIHAAAPRIGVAAMY